MPETSPSQPLVPRLTRGWMQGPAPARYLLLSLLLIIALQLAAALGSTLVLRPGFIVWRPTVGVGVALLLLFGVRYLPALVVGIWLDALRIGGASYALRAGLLQTALESAALLLIALLVRRIAPGGRSVRLRLQPLLLIVALLGPVLLVPANVLRATVADGAPLGVAAGVELERGILLDWLADALGLLIMVPLLISTLAPAVERRWRAAATSPRTPRLSAGLSVELLLQALSIPAALALCYGLERMESFQGSYISFLPIFWIALRWGLPGATLGSAATALLAVYLLRIIQPGETRAVEVQVMLLVLSITGLLVGGGVSESRRAARALRKATAEDELLRRVADTANGAHSPDEAVREVLRLVCAHTGWAAAHAYYAEGDVLTPGPWWSGGHAGRLRRLRAPRRTARLAAGVGLAGRAFATGEAQWRRDLTALAFPVHLQQQVVAVLEFATADSAAHPEPPDARRLVLMDAVGAQLARVIERSRSLAELRDTNERLGQVLTSITDGLIVFDAEGRIRFANPRAEEIFGTSAAELIGRGAGELFPGEGGALFRREYRRAEVEREPRHFEGYYAPCEAWLELHLYPTREGLSIYFRDITRRKELDRRMEESEQRYRSLFHYNANAVYSVDFAGRFISANPACERVTGYPAEELLRMSLFELVVPEDRQRLEDAFHHAANEVTQVLDVGLISAEGERVETSTTTVPIVVGGEVVGLFALSTDVTEQKRTEAALRESEERFRLMVEGSEQVFFYACDRNGRFQYLSPSVKEVTGFDASELVGRPSEVLFSLEPPTALAAEILGRQARAAGKRAPRAAQVAHRDGHFLTMELVESAVEPGGTQGFARDVSERVELEEQLAHDAFHDGLTGLPNRALFMDRLRHTSDLAQRQGVGLFAVLVVDLDRFKVINDSLGHAVGDRLLASVAQRLLSCVRPGDTVARFGGDEFVLLLEELREGTDATRVARRILRELSAPLALEGHEIFTDASIGIAFCSTDQVAPEELLRNADAAMYRAKGQGKGRYEVFDREMHSQAMQRLQVETDLRRAIERDELFVCYQPIVELRTREIVAFEALVRWRHPERGVLAPAEFIGVAEETGLIASIDHWVLREACLQMREWEERFPGPPLRLSVNLSGKQFAHPDLVDRIREVLEETRANPALLRLEITEGVLVENAERAAAMLTELRGLKIQFLIDDFGTGYSSLSYLQRLPIDTLKIDRSFVSGGDGEHKEIVQAVVSMAHSMNLGVVAEGMETPEQLERLQALECDYGQGFLFSRPVVGDALEALLVGRG